MDHLTKLAEKLEEIAAAGHMRSFLILCGILTVTIPLLLILTPAILESRQRKLENMPVVFRARRLALFYDDRPLRAELQIKYDSRKARAEALKQDFPECDPDDLSHAIDLAEYNEFIRHELDHEIHVLKQDYTNCPRSSMKLAVRILEESKNNIRRGILVRFAYKHSERFMYYDLADAHEWLKVLTPGKKISPADRYQAIKAHKYQCAWCGRDWNDDIELEAVMTKGGTLAPICTECRIKNTVTQIREAGKRPAPESAKNADPAETDQTTVKQIAFA